MRRWDYSRSPNRLSREAKGIAHGAISRLASQSRFCKLGCEGIVSKRIGPSYRSGRSRHWIKVENPSVPAAKREAEEDWGR
jgi:ATP-dependent DNA ligase